MPVDLTAALAPIKVRLAEVTTERAEMKLSIAKKAAAVVAAQKAVDESQATIEKLNKTFTSVNPAHLSWCVANLTAHSELLGRATVDKERDEWILAAVDSDYMGIEGELKAKILELSGGDASLFPIHVPVHPVGLSVAAVSGARQMALDARMQERVDYMNNQRFRTPLPDNI